MRLVTSRIVFFHWSFGDTLGSNHSVASFISLFFSLSFFVFGSSGGELKKLLVTIDYSLTSHSACGLALATPANMMSPVIFVAVISTENLPLRILPLVFFSRAKLSPDRRKLKVVGACKYTGTFQFV